MLIAGNWKMYKTVRETRTFCEALRNRVPPADRDLAVVVCPPYPSLAAAADVLDGSGIRVFAQNVHWAEEGPFTGEVSPRMLRELGVTGALVGHSERRQYFGETDETVARRAVAALEGGLDVIACVGESEEERDAGQTELVVRLQVESLADAVGDDAEALAIAYEPVWAIGTGRTATPEQAEDAHALIRAVFDVRLLYGGSVKPENVEELLAQPDVDGALVGGASLEVESFTAICETAARLSLS
ncbi:MAG: triose-phosphate isomerase [Actinomycetota bacterium]|nr:triose-phosphate isomerase [Actinomycetota bacterium]